MKFCPNFIEVLDYAKRKIENTGMKIEALHWQGVKAPAPMIEVMDFIFQMPMPTSWQLLQESMSPDLPWAELHFQERISGVPFNPPPSHNYWPHGVHDGNETFLKDGQFDHTYPERFWPKYANQLKVDGIQEINEGIRFKHGDLDDVINQLSKDILTRQAYLPIFFPEDTGALGGTGRVPCTLGYHFMIRKGHLHITYHMRSCDYLRHFTNDIYMAIRLAQHVCEKVNKYQEYEIRMGMIKFWADSFHIFEFDKKKI